MFVEELSVTLKVFAGATFVAKADQLTKLVERSAAYVWPAMPRIVKRNCPFVSRVGADRAAFVRTNTFTTAEVVAAP